MARQITCTNKNNNHSMTFAEDGFNPLLLASVSGIYDTENEVTMVDGTIIDGATYQGSRQQKRNIVLTLLADPQTDETFVYNQPIRDDLRLIFQKGVKGELIYEENGTARKIDYYTESITRAPKGSRLFTISLLCDNPKFRDIDDTIRTMGDYIELFEFDHDFPEEDEELETKSTEQSVNIINDTGNREIGLTIKIEALAAVTNPSIYHAEQDKHITVGMLNRPFEMQTGDILIITTGIGNKHIKLKRWNTETEINSYLELTSEFFQLGDGDNHISYNAESGADYMSVTISYCNEYEGA